jgi:hypothetical protein
MCARENAATVYLAQCVLARDQLYVGKTERTLEERKREHEAAAVTGNVTPFHRALVAEGIRHWEWRVLETCDQALVAERERYWIAKLNALSIDLLNVSHARPKPTGGIRRDRVASRMGGKNVWTIPSARRWLQLSGKLKPAINLTSGQRFRSLSEAAAGGPDGMAAVRASCATGKPTPAGNRYAWLDAEQEPVLTDGHRNQIPRGRRVKNLLTGQISDSAAVAAKAVGVPVKMLQAVCNGDYRSCSGLSFCYLDDEGAEVLKSSHQRYLARKKAEASTAYAAYRVGSEDKRPLIFSTIKELCQTLGIPKEHVLGVCKGERQHTKGYRIAFYDKSTERPVFTDAHTRAVRKLLRRVVCLDDGATYDTASAAARRYGLEAQQVALCCRGVLKTTGRGGTRRRFAYADDRGDPLLTPKHGEPLEMRKTRLFCPQLAREFQSVAQFCRETGVPGKRARRHLEDPAVDLGGLELVRLS